jgi:hypothetical protein
VTTAEQALADWRATAPATRANFARNARAERDRHTRWTCARDALWALLEPLLSPTWCTSTTWRRGGPGHPQPTTLEHALARNTLAGLRGPCAWDPRVARGSLGIAVRAERLWHWPFADSVDYLIQATIAGQP